MKCPYCGGEVGLEETLCPYCGRPNEQAAQHHRDMASYRSRYAETEAAVVGKAERYARIVPRTVVIVLLLIAAAVMSWIAENAYYMPENFRRRSAEKHAEETIALLDACLEERDYIAMASWFSYYDIRTYDWRYNDNMFSKYSELRWSTEYYKDFVIQMEKLFLHGDSDSWRKYEASGNILRMCQAIETVLDSTERGLRETDSETQRAALEDMRENMFQMLEVFLGLNREEAEEFITLSDNKKAALVEEVLLGA